MPRGLLIDIYILLVIWAAVVANLSVILHSRVAWRSTVIGRHLMIYMGVIAAVLDLSVLRVIFTWDTDWFLMINVLVFAGVPLAMTQRAWLQWQAQRPQAPNTPPEGIPEVESIK